jgi:lipopolysaccharide export LptBFGC system permease protein LptF
MRSVKKLGLLVTALAFFLGIFVVTGNAQYDRNRRWQNNNDGSLSEYRNRNRRWRNGYDGYGRITPQEARRLQRQRYRLYNQRNRAYRDGYVTDRERWKLQRKYYKYRRNVYRDRRDW